MKGNNSQRGPEGENSSRMGAQRRRRSALRRTRSATVILLVFLLQSLLLTDETTLPLVRADGIHQKRRRRGRRRLQRLGNEPVTVETKPGTMIGSPATIRAAEQQAPAAAAAESGDDEECTEAAGPCERCTDSDRFLFPEACAATGKRQPYRCGAFARSLRLLIFFVSDRMQCAYRSSHPDHYFAETYVEGGAPRTIYKGCERTVEDEKFAMMRFQILCLLAGAAAFVSVKQQKASAATLFDQRKLNLQKKRRTSENPHDGVEMTSMVRQEETKSLLVEINENLDVV